MATKKAKGATAKKAAPADDKAPAQAMAGAASGEGPSEHADPRSAPHASQAGPADEQGKRDDTAAEAAGLPKGSAASLGAPPTPTAGPIRNVPSAGGTIFQLPGPTSGRFAMPDDDETEPDPAEVAKRAEELLAEKDRIPAGTPEARASAALADARSELKAREAVKAQAKKAGEQKAGVTREQAELKERQREERKAVYMGADFATNPRAYAADPNNAADQGPKEPIAVDYRRIQDEEGRLAGNLPAPT